MFQLDIALDNTNYVIIVEDY